MGLRVLQENRLCRLLFTFQTTCNQWLQNGCKPKLPFKSPKFAKPAATRSLPRGGGLGRGHSPNFGNLSQHLNRPNTSLSACCPLSSSLPRERGRAAVGVKGSARKIGCADCFLFFRRPFKRSIQAVCILIILKKPIKISHLHTVQAAFPILATRAGFPPVRRLSAAKSRDSKTAAR